MKTIAVLTLLAFIPRAEAQVQQEVNVLEPSDEPMAIRVEEADAQVFTPDGPKVVRLPVGYWVNPAFATNVVEKDHRLRQDLAKVSAERDSYKTQAAELAAMPGPSATTAVVAAVVGVVLGVAGGVALGLALSK